MSKKLSVIIPCYNDNPERAINSIKNQLYYDSRDIEIILIMDNPERVLNYPDVITIETDRNVGAGLARQKGIDIATGEYFTFLDSDDIIYNSLFFALFLRDVYWQGANEFDIIKFGILEQMENQMFSQKHNDSTWCFSKVYKTSFIRKNNIKFHPLLRVHEDSYFIRLAELHNPHILNHEDLIYLWVHNPQSIVRLNNGEYGENSFSEYIKMQGFIIEEHIKLDKEYYGLNDITFFYYIISKMHNKKYIKICIDEINKIKHDYRRYFKMDEQLQQALINVGMNNSNKNVSKFSFEEFRKMLLGEIKID